MLWPLRSWSLSEYVDQGIAWLLVIDTRGLVNWEQSMKDKAIRDLIRQLHSTLNGASTISDQDREQLEQLSADLQALLSEPGAATRASHQTLMGRLLAAVTRFEVSHPDLAATMGQVSQTLSDMGI
jgi:ABC-type transporter Mla subunit MlaD